VKLYDGNKHIIDTDALAKEAQQEERKINSAIRSLTGAASDDLTTTNDAEYDIDEDI